MVALDPSAQEFLEVYERQYRQYQTEAHHVRDLIGEITRSTGPLVHTITARAKSPESVRAKIRRKHYRDPEQQVMDLIGVRIITYYHDDVQPIVAQLQENLDINISESVDKRVQLGLREFGYRSVQLVARPKADHAYTRSLQIPQDRWFEIQIRSILEHAWAEIEHEIVYKSGVQYPEDVVRRFASLAGTLELLDNEFLALRHERNDLINRYRDIYTQNEENLEPFDVARLLGFLEASRPRGRSWRQSEEAGVPFHPGLDASCVEALKAVGLDTPGALEAAFNSPRFHSALSLFATSHGIAPENVSHVAAVVLAVVVTDARVVKRYFPEIMIDSVIERMVLEALSD